MMSGRGSVWGSWNVMAASVNGVRLEVERKFDLAGDDVLPELDDVAGVGAVQVVPATRLTATYFDTADLRLARAGMVLRRRTGGSDAGWHVKLPARAGSSEGRLEVRRPAGRSASSVPVELSELVRGPARGGPVRPVVRVRTSRQVTRLLAGDGSVLAEVADDTVTAERLTGPGATSGADGDGQRGPVSWREVEIELVDGDRSLLAKVGKRLRRAGARPSAAASKLARALSRLDLDAASGGRPGRGDVSGKPPRSGAVALAHLHAQTVELVARDPQVRLDLADSVHRMRVATRRLRSTLATFGPFFDPEPVAHLRGELAWLAGVLGAARDAEVMRERLTAAVTALPPESVIGPVRERITATFDQAYRQAHIEVVAALDGRRYLDLLAGLDTLLADPPLTPRAARPATSQVHTRVRHTLRRVQRALAAARAQTDPHQQDLLLHEVRKAAKRARYAGEAVTAVFGARARRYATAMKAVHETLGDHQDALLTRRALHDLAQQAHQAGENTFTYGLLAGLETRGAGDTVTALADSTSVIKKAGTTWPS
jgi:CHAD domain-containing protein